MNKKLVFIVEDNEMTSFSIEQKLKKEKDVEVRHFTTVKDAIEEVNDKPDIIVLDHHLEQTTGISCIPLFREFSPNTYILVYSEQSNIIWFDKAYLLGADAYLIKTIDHKLLINKLAEVLNRQKETISPWYVRVAKSLFASKDIKRKIKRVLVVEDNEMFAYMVEQAFKESLFIHSEFYKTPDQFLANLGEDPPDIYILDYHLNDELTGKDLLLKIKAVNPKAIIIILSAQKDIEVAVDLMYSGATYYLVKTKENLPRLVKIIEGL